MANIVKPIEAKSVHLIQSGQVIVDLCSVVKELVENGLDAGANTIEVRFKNNGLDEIEVQDNGSGIAAVNYESVALKHYTSKLSTYDDLSSLQTFGFRGEALSSLCALSTFNITTAQADEVPKGHRLEFEISGKLKSTSIVAAQKGTTVTVQNLFEKLPVRRKELSKNIKREYGKVLGLLHAYACISINVKITVKNAMPKAKSITVFSTKSNTTTRENIANVYGARTLSALVELKLELDFDQSSTQAGHGEQNLKKVVVCGHISKPVFGEGRQTPDRQMFFVNGRPCGLPQIAKAINEVYKSFNVSQSPFIFADFQMDTSAYDVNVSPDKRTILLHDATALTESLKVQLNNLFDHQDQTVPQSHVQSSKLPAFKQLSLRRESSSALSERSSSAALSDLERIQDEPEFATSAREEEQPNVLLHDHFRNLTSTREEPLDSDSERNLAKITKQRERWASKVADRLTKQPDQSQDSYRDDDLHDTRDPSDGDPDSAEIQNADQIHIRDFNARMLEQQQQSRIQTGKKETNTNERVEEPIPALSPLRQIENPGAVPSAYNRMRPRHAQPEVVEITIGDKTVTRIIGSQASHGERNILNRIEMPATAKNAAISEGIFARSLQKFSGPGTQALRSDENCVEGDQEARIPFRRQETQQEDIKSVERDATINPSTQEILASHTPRFESGNVKYADSNHLTEEDDRAAEEKRVAELIRLAEADAAQENTKGEKRAVQVLKGGRIRDSIVSLAVEVDVDVDAIAKSSELYFQNLPRHSQKAELDRRGFDEEVDTAEERLSLTVSKADFLNMHIVGQFNLGFILAVRPKHLEGAVKSQANKDELFIIDQHASDEKYNFERLQAETVVGNQRMVRPALLDLTAVEEEIVIDNMSALEKNGFVVDIDNSGDREVGKRCRLVSLPLSKEVVFGTQDLDELIHLLAESPMLNDSSPVPRPSKVRKMFAMRACRSSIMIGKTLSRKQMSTILQHMGSIDKPWNCPHGRPTMRHLASLDEIEACLWEEGDGVYPGEEPASSGSKAVGEVWKSYME